jgi:YVTN family beta-propeller protein
MVVTSTQEKQRLQGGYDVSAIARRGGFRAFLGLILATSFGVATAAPNVTGAWSPVISWPLIPLHMVLMPDGRVLSFGTNTDGTQTGYFIYDVWDPAAGLSAGHTTLANTTGTDLFCSSTLVLPQGGKVFIAGGDNWTGTATTNTGNNNSNLFNYTNNTLTRQGDMNRARWYSTSTVLLNGEVYIQGGDGGADYPEIRATSGAFRLLTGADTNSFDNSFPRNFIAPDGRVFGYDGNGRMYYVNTAGNGSVSNAGQFSGPTGGDSSAAMFQPGRILQFGGNSNGALVIDITSGAPVVTPTGSLSSRRRLVNATILANGKVLATGGSSVWNVLTNVNNSAEIWDPKTGAWTVGASGDRARLYHSTAMLMPDASVLVAGGGAPGPQNNTNFEVYYPPYLYDASGAFAPRPAIRSAPSVIDIGQTFSIDFVSSQSIGRVVMIKTTAVTHGFNMEQRFNELTFTASGNRLMVQSPTRAANAPPGFYLLFVLDSAGVPSVARIVKVNVATVLNPAVTPVLAAPGNQAGLVGTPVSLQLAATDPNGDVLGFGASGLPAGLTINGTTGVISGTPTAPGIYSVVVAASDGVNSDVRNFVWTVTLAGSFTINPMPSPAPQLAGGSVTFTASVTGGSNVQYQWDFDDGTPVTSLSPEPTITHSFKKPGVYYVSVTAIDDSGLPQTTTVVQTVHLPLSANRPAVSSNIAYEDRTAANDRLWVVNQDNDSVSVFDAVTNAKLAEITVGIAPRTLAIAPNGEIWVTNKQSATLSVVSPSTLAVTRTLSLPFASQPFGIAMAPNGGFAYVALEAAGKLLQMDVAGYTVAGSVAVGSNPRHVSVNSSGSLVYVSRFITPFQPGESTALVQTSSGGTPTGGEIVVVDAASMVPQKTIVLRHSDKPDAENQGRGVPNYLGAATLSPDGRSAWVPSKQDNIQRGVLRDNRGLDFQNTVRAIGSRIVIADGTEDYAARLDFDNSGIASAALFDQLGVYLFVALESSREVAIVSAHDDWEIFRIDVGRAPQGLALSADGRTLYVNNFMDRTVSSFNLTSLVVDGKTNVPLRATLAAVGTEKLSATVLKGKQFFYDAKDTRLARDAYISCASCHNDGGQDGRVWDLTGFGEGLRNTVNLRGRAATGQGFLHWSNNFDEVQDFEGQIRNLAGGTGLMTNSQFSTGTRSQPLGDRKTGVSPDLDALAAYVASLNAFASSPLRSTSGSLTSAAVAGKAVFVAKNCASCHGGKAFTNSASSNPQDVGTLTAASGKRLGGPLTGIDIPTLRDVWATAPYLHDGSAATIGNAIQAHEGFTATAAELGNLAAYVAQVGGQETTAPTSSTPNTGAGLTGRYFNNTSLSGTPVLQRIEAVNFGWSTNSPGPGVNADNFSVRWSGKVEATSTGSFQFQTASNDGVRVWINGVLVINNWTSHATTTNNSASIALTGGTRYAVKMEFYDGTGSAVARLRWKQPGQTSFVAIPASRLYSN